MSETITVDKVKAALVEIATEHPTARDTVNPRDTPARYIVEGKPSSLVARVLVKAGFPVPVLRTLDFERPLGSLDEPGVRLGESRHPALRRIDPHALALLQYVQRRQDQPWGEAVNEALRPSRLGRRFTMRSKPWLQ